MMQLRRMSKVYSYSRWSTDEQSKGDSFRRQSDAAAKWAHQRGLELDERLSYQDSGVSAYRDSNAASDSGLGNFLEACRKELVEPGSFLLVESLDRISRMTPRRAQSLINDIVDSGVTIVTLNDGQEYTAARLDEDPMALLISMMVSWRAHEESKTKGRRLAAAWAEKRRKVRAGESGRLTSRAPAWLTLDGDGFKVDEVKAEVVRRIYRMTLEGAGEHLIAHRLNAEGVPPLGRAKFWHRSSVAKILRNDAVIGRLRCGYMDFEGGKSRRVMEEPIENAFPAIIAEADWLAVKAIKDTRGSTRGKHGSAPVTNIFAGLAKCPECGAAMTRVYKGGGPKGGKPKLVCTQAKLGAAAHGYRAVDLPTLEEAFRRDWQALLLADVPAGERGVAMDDDFNRLEATVSALEDHLQELLEIEAQQRSRAVVVRIVKLEAEIETLRAELADLGEQRAVADGGLMVTRAGALADRLADEENPPAPAEINGLLRTLFSGVVVDYREGFLRFQWRQGGSSDVMYGWPDETAAVVNQPPS
jgi:DNA invertase Pin-like site-specific DNA recombinase